jgi:hypothetical protein
MCQAGAHRRRERREHVEDAPVLRDRTGKNPPCEACGAHHTELHHFAPRAVFDDEADLSPQSSLCRPSQAG